MQAFHDFKQGFLLKPYKPLVTELLFFASLLILGKLWAWLAAAQSDKLFSLYGNITDLTSITDMQAFISAFKVYLGIMIPASVLLVVAVLLLFVLSRGITWTFLLKKPFSKKVYWKMVVFKIAWFVVWIPLLIIFIVPVFLLSSTVDIDPGAIPLYAASIYANLLLYLIIAYVGIFAYQSFLTHNKIYQAITDSFKHAIKGAKKVLPMIGLSIITFIILYALFHLLDFMELAFWWLKLLLFIYVFNACRRSILSRLT